jgi:hypothetical protein
VLCRKLSEYFGCWSDKLCEDAVYQSILEIFAGVKKGVGQGPVGSTNRGEIKQLVEVDPRFRILVHSWIRD